MNTQGHHQVADEAGLPRLKQAFADLGVSDVNLTAFYLGNWLTDLSQVVDPNPGLLSFVAGEIGDRIDVEMGPILAALHAFIAEQIGPEDAIDEAKGKGVLDGAAAAWVETARKEMTAAANEAVKGFRDAMKQLVQLLAAMGKDNPDDLNELLTATVRFTAYRKFVHPKKPKEPPGLDFRVFGQIFDSNFSQYFPHEHVDRPQCEVTLDGECREGWGAAAVARYPKRLYANKLANGERSVGSSEPSIYAFLEETRRVVSGSLARIDRDWAARYFTTGADYRSDPAFHIGLADLGHALHAVEDFFAHSNFIEHAAATRGEAYLRKQLYAQVPGPGVRVTRPTRLAWDKADFAAVKVMRRLKRFEPGVEAKESAGWAFLPDEHSIVTGYFDGWDTTMSLLHAFEELFPHDEAAGATDIVTDYVTELVTDRAGEVLDPLGRIVATLKGETGEGKLRRELDTLMDYFTHNRILELLDVPAAKKEIQAKIKKDGLFANVPESMRDTVVVIVFGFVDRRAIQVQAGRISWNLYQLIEAVTAIIENPLRFFTEPLLVRKPKGAWFHTKFVMRWVTKILIDPRFDALRFELRTRIHAALGGYRVGSHSLLAKDYSDEPLFPQAFNCARSLHWYVVHTLCRWADADWLENASDDEKWVDWHEMLGHFLKHPRAHAKTTVVKPEEVEITGFEFHRVETENETFRTIALARRDGGTRRYGSYEELLLANIRQGRLFDAGPVGGTRIDERRVADIVVATRMGTTDGRGYQLRVGLTVWVPFTVNLLLDRIDQESLWFRDVMDLTTKEWRGQISLYEAGKSRRSRPPYEYHKTKYFAAANGVSAETARDAFISGAKAVQKSLEETVRGGEEAIAVGERSEARPELVPKPGSFGQSTQSGSSSALRRNVAEEPIEATYRRQLFPSPRRCALSGDPINVRAPIAPEGL